MVFLSKAIAIRVAVVAALLLIGGVWWLRSARKPVVLLEAARSELVSRENRLYRQGEQEPFCGALVERYPGGSMQSRSVLSNGVLHGLSEGWYTNGVVQVREYFKDGVSHGVRTKWHETGAKMSEANIVLGKIHGSFRRWHENGALAEEVEMDQGEPHGWSMAYFPSGSLKAKAKLEHGKVIEQTYWNDGEMKAPSSGENQRTHADTAVK